MATSTPGPTLNPFRSDGRENILESSELGLEVLNLSFSAGGASFSAAWRTKLTISTLAPNANPGQIVLRINYTAFTGTVSTTLRI